MRQVRKEIQAGAEAQGVEHMLMAWAGTDRD